MKLQFNDNSLESRELFMWTANRSDYDVVVGWRSMIFHLTENSANKPE